MLVDPFLGSHYSFSQVIIWCKPLMATNVVGSLNLFGSFYEPQKTTHINYLLTSSCLQKLSATTLVPSDQAVVSNDFCNLRASGLLSSRMLVFSAASVVLILDFLLSHYL